MYYYFFSFLTFTIFLTFFIKNIKFLHILNISVFILIIGFVGLRHEISGDWHVYQSLFRQFKTLGFPSIQLFTSSDPLYITINILIERSGYTIHLVNLIISIFFFLGLFLILKGSKYKLISILSAFLPLIVILSMGYTRQSLAVSFTLFFYFFFIDRRYFLSFFFIILAIASHKTSLIYFASLMFILILSNKNFRQLKIFIPAAIIILIFINYYSVDMIRMYKVYLSNSVELSADLKQELFSPGVLFKSAILVFFALIYYIFFKNLKFINKNEELIYNSLIFLVIMPLPLIGYFSSFVDRLLVYNYIFIPLVVNKILNSYAFGSIKKIFYWHLFLIFFSFSTLFIWMEFANHSKYWKPYQNYLMIENNLN